MNFRLVFYNKLKIFKNIKIYATYVKYLPPPPPPDCEPELAKIAIGCYSTNIYGLDTLYINNLCKTKSFNLLKF